MSDVSTWFRKISSDEIKKHIGEDVRIVFLADETLGNVFTACTCKVMLGYSGNVVLSDGDNIEDIDMPLEELVLRAHITGEKCVWKIDTTHADVLKYERTDFKNTQLNAVFFRDFMMPSGFNLLEKGVEVYAA